MDLSLNIDLKVNLDSLTSMTFLNPKGMEFKFRENIR